MGTEPSIRSGGAFLTLLAYLVFPIILCIPEAFVTAELSTLYPEASGGVAWVEEAFGNMAGWIVGCLSWVAGVTDSAIYPALFLDYWLQLLLPSFPMIANNHHVGGGVVRYTILTAITLLLGYINYRGLKVVGDMSLVLCAIAMAPFVVFCVLAIPKIETFRWFQMPSMDKNDQYTNLSGGFLPHATWGGVLWRPFLNNLLWNLNYFDTAASFAADVRDPGRVYPRAMTWAVAMVMAAYFVPLLVVLGASNASQEDWVNGYLATAIANVQGPWLGAWVVFGITVSNVGLYLAEMSYISFKVLGMAERGFLPRAFQQRSPYGTPTYGILVSTAVIVVLNVGKLDTLVEMLNFNYSM